MLDFVLGALLWTLGICVGLGGLYVLWRYVWSVPVVEQYERAILYFLGRPVRSVGPGIVGGVYQPGPHFVPYFPFKWWRGHRLWELVRFPTIQVPFRYEGKLEHKVYTKDNQRIAVEVSGYTRAPYDEFDSLVMMAESGVPMANQKIMAINDPAAMAEALEAAMQGWMEEEIQGGVRAFMPKFTVDEATSTDNIDAINTAAKAYFLREDGLFAKSGICGNDRTNFTPGTGEVILRIEQVSTTQTLQDAREAPVVARYRKDAAAAVAQQERVETLDPLDIAMDEWATKRAAILAEADPAYATADEAGRKKILAEKLAAVVASSDYAKEKQVKNTLLLGKRGSLQVARTELGSPDGSPLPASLQYLSIGGGGGAGVLFGGGQGKSEKDKTSAEKWAEADRIMRGGGANPQG